MQTIDRLPKHIESNLVVIMDKDRNVTGYGRPNHHPMQDWGDYTALTADEIAAYRVDSESSPVVD